MDEIRTVTLDRSAADLDRAAAMLAAGQLVAFATETVYGLGADALGCDKQPER